MKIAYLTDVDAMDIRSFSGTTYHMSTMLAHDHELSYVGKLQRARALRSKLHRSVIKRLTGKNMHSRFFPEVLGGYARQAEAQLASIQPDVVVTPSWAPIAQLNCQQPLYLWTDIGLPSLAGQLYDKDELSSAGWKQLYNATLSGMERCRRVYLTSEWARKKTLQDFPVDPEKIRVLPYGANLESVPDRDEVEARIASRSLEPVQLVLVGKVWHEKGAPIAVEVVRTLESRGIAATLTIVGTSPPPGTLLPANVTATGFINKSSPQGAEQFDSILASADFFILPTRADAFGIAFCEAKAYGLPCLGTRLSAVPEIINDGVSGKTFDFDAPADAYADYIAQLHGDRSLYQAHSRAALAEYHTRFSWSSAVQRFMADIENDLSAAN